MNKRFYTVCIALITLLAVVMVTPVAAENHCDDAPYIPENRLSNPFGGGNVIGRVAQQYSSIRAGIGSSTVYGIMVTGQDFRVVGEAVCVGAHWWIPVELDAVDEDANPITISGYAAEGYEGNYWLEPDESATAQTLTPVLDEVSGVLYLDGLEFGCPGGPPALLGGAGADFAQVAQRYSTIRAGVNSPIILYVLTGEDKVEVIDGPWCGIGPYNWVEVRYITASGMTIEGWATEGSGDEVWLEPIEE